MLGIRVLVVSYQAPIKNASRADDQVIGDTLFGKHLDQSMLTVSITQFIHGHEQCCTQEGDNHHTSDHLDSSNVEDSENDQQHNHSTTQICDVLRFESFELNWFVYAFIDFIYTVHITSLNY